VRVRHASESFFVFQGGKKRKKDLEEKEAGPTGLDGYPRENDGPPILTRDGELGPLAYIKWGEGLLNR